ncbi:MAG: class I SAM-dependent methyltransferase [Chitinivibrionales bacterium]|nr:class I SAM-dependent methyltransferase [Chitinivibrionales bacterium]
MKNYVHGYSQRETLRLQDQAMTLEDLLHHDSIFPSNSTILEPGCGVGSQTRIIAAKNPSCHFVSLDISTESLAKARSLSRSLKLTNVEFKQANLFNLEYPDESFDHIFCCFVLEHLPDPVAAIGHLKRVLKRGGSITIIEGDHGSAYFFPQSSAAQKNIFCQVQLQANAGGNALIGRELYPLLRKAGFSDCTVSNRMVYTDSSKPSLVDGFTKKTFIAMIEGVGPAAVQNSLISQQEWDTGMRDLYRTTEEDGVFCYTFFKGKARKK